MSKHNFTFPNIEIRSQKSSDGSTRYVVKGYAVAKNVPHTYRYESDADGNVKRAFKSYFTGNFESSMLRQLKTKPIFVDALHQTATNINIRSILDRIKEKDPKLSSEVSEIESNLKVTQVPLAKVVDFRIDDHGLFVETELNPHFREVDDGHRRYFDVIWRSLQDGYINTMSINFAPTTVVYEGDMERIDDGEVFGISYQSGGALGEEAGIIEVAMRAMMETRSPVEAKTNMVENTNAENEALKQQVAQMNEQLRKLQETQMQAQEAERQRSLELEKQKWQMENENLKRQLEELQTKQTMQQTEKGSRGTVPQQDTPIYDPSAAKNLVNQLSWKELWQIQSENGSLVGNEQARAMGLLRRSPDDLRPR